MARQSWPDEKTQTAVIDDYARQLGSFIDALADGRIDASELASQEGRLVAAMKEVEPQLDDELHGKVTQMLCELSVYNIMQMLHEVHEARPKTVFQG